MLLDKVGRHWFRHWGKRLARDLRRQHPGVHVVIRSRLAHRQAKLAIPPTLYIRGRSAQTH